MSRFLRFFVVWLCCTALTATAVFLTVRFVLGSTAPLPPSTAGVTTVLALATASPGAPASTAIGTPASTPDASPSASRPKPSPSATTPSASAAQPRQSSTPAAGRVPTADCTGGAGVHSFSSTGGQVVVRFGSDALCLVSAVPALGFTTSTTQSSPGTLTVTFSGAHHRSELTASLQPQAQEVTREVSW
ncbi:hypothetical protein EDD99_0329 [Streptomyces sp. 846.5]|nr:hypothetical protein [Streptomyces sp. 846.5]TDU01945.1 hypothetical protein EDD99_0329 [Streptomyces sp. 846.5]